MKQVYLIRQNKSKVLFKVFLLVLITFFSSCENEKYDSLEKKSTTQNEITLKNGRLHFQSKESFITIYNEYINLPEEKLSNLLTPFYQKGFYSVRPIVTEKNEEFLFNHYKEKLKEYQNLDIEYAKTKAGIEPYEPLEPFEEAEEIIGDDTFAALLNIDGEIQIGEEIYKYTDVGLFIADETEYVTLDDYLEVENISDDLYNDTPLVVKEGVTLLLPPNFPTAIGTHSSIVYYRPSTTTTSTTSTYTSPTPGSPAASDPSYNAFFNNLSSCDPHSGLFGNLFGDNNVCIDKYESKRRVKTKAFNYNYFLVYHMGVKCVHQFKGWTGFWRVEATDEIRLVVESAMFEYDVDKLLGNTLIKNNSQIKDIYLNNQRITYGPNTINVNGPYGFTYSNLDQSSLPQIFQNSGMGLSFEMYGTGIIPLDNLIQNGIDSNANAKKLNEHIWNTGYDEIKNLIRRTQNNSSYTPPPNRTFAAKYPENGKIIITKTVLDQGLNIGVRDKTFDWGAEFRFEAKDKGDGSWKMTGGQGSLLARPEKFRVKIIGAVRKGNAWHGSKFSVGID